MHTAGAPSNELVGFDEVREGVRRQGRHVDDHTCTFLRNACEDKNMRHGESYTKTETQNKRMTKLRAENELLWACTHQAETTVAN